MIYYVKCPSFQDQKNLVEFLEKKGFKFDYGAAFSKAWRAGEYWGGYLEYIYLTFSSITKKIKINSFGEMPMIFKYLEEGVQGKEINPSASIDELNACLTNE